MKSRLIKVCLQLGLIASALTTAGCGRQSYNKQYYMLEADRTSPVAETKMKVALALRLFAIDSAFSSRKLVYRTGDMEYESDFYNEFLVSPAAMMTEKTRNWLSKSGRFERVLDSASIVDPTHLIEANITALYGDFRDESSPAAVMELRIFVLKTKAAEEPVAVFGKTYALSVDLESEGPQGLIQAFDRCLEQILTNFEQDLARNLP